MTTAQRIKSLYDRVPIDWTGHRNIEMLVYLTDSTEKIAAMTETLTDGIAFTFRDGSRLTYNTRAERAAA